MFTDGNKRPRSIEFTSSDLLLLGYWNSSIDSKWAEVISMAERE